VHSYVVHDNDGPLDSQLYDAVDQTRLIQRQPRLCHNRLVRMDSACSIEPMRLVSHFHPTTVCRRRQVEDE